MGAEKKEAGGEKEGRGRWWMTGTRGVGSEGWLAVESGGGTGMCPEVEEVEEEYAAARKSRPIFQRGTIARLSDRATT